MIVLVSDSRDTGDHTSTCNLVKEFPSVTLKYWWKAFSLMFASLSEALLLIWMVCFYDSFIITFHLSFRPGTHNLFHPYDKLVLLSVGSTLSYGHKRLKCSVHCSLIDICVYNMPFPTIMIRQYMFWYYGAAAISAVYICDMVNRYIYIVIVLRPGNSGYLCLWQFLSGIKDCWLDRRTTKYRMPSNFFHLDFLINPTVVSTPWVI